MYRDANVSVLVGCTYFASARALVINSFSKVHGCGLAVWLGCGSRGPIALGEALQLGTNQDAEAVALLHFVRWVDSDLGVCHELVCRVEAIAAGVVTALEESEVERLVTIVNDGMEPSPGTVHRASRALEATPQAAAATLAGLLRDRRREPRAHALSDSKTVVEEAAGNHRCNHIF